MGDADAGRTSRALPARQPTGQSPTRLPQPPQELKARTKLAVSGQFNALDLNKVRLAGWWGQPAAGGFNCLRLLCLPALERRLPCASFRLVRTLIDPHPTPPHCSVPGAQVWVWLQHCLLIGLKLELAGSSAMRCCGLQ